MTAYITVSVREGRPERRTGKFDSPFVLDARVEQWHFFVFGRVEQTDYDPNVRVLVNSPNVKVSIIPFDHFRLIPLPKLGLPFVTISKKWDHLKAIRESGEGAIRVIDP